MRHSQSQTTSHFPSRNEKSCQLCCGYIYQHLNDYVLISTRKYVSLAKSLLRQMKFIVSGANCDNTAQQEGKHEPWQNTSVSFNTVDVSLK